MGFFFTLLYIVTAYLAPGTLFGGLAEYHVEIVIVSLALILSLFSAAGSGLSRMTQTWAIAGLCMAVACSMIFSGWLGGAPKRLIEFLPDVTSFFLIVLNCRKKWQLQVLIALLFLVAVFVIGQGSYALSNNDLQSKYLLSQRVSEETGASIIRFRGLSFLGDPNDFAQFMVSLIPCMFFFWAKGKSFRNVVLVYLPAACLFYGMYLTHSRGGMVALMAVAIVAGRRRIGVVPAVVIGAALFAGLSAAGFSGGRDVSAGEDRIGAWSTGVSLILSHPVFGVGFERFGDFNDITAHNTFVVCAAELGLIGVFFWILFMLVTLHDVFVGSIDPNAPVKNKKDLSRGLGFGLEAQPAAGAVAMKMPVASALSPAHLFAGDTSARKFLPDTSTAQGNLGYGSEFGFGSETTQESDEELRRLCSLMVLSFAGFLTAGWFLSRSYTMCLYVNAGIGAATYNIAARRGIAPPPLSIGRAMKFAALTVLVLLIVVYTIVRVDHLFPH